MMQGGKKRITEDDIAPCLGNKGELKERMDGQSREDINDYFGREVGVLLLLRWHCTFSRWALRPNFTQFRVRRELQNRSHAKHVFKLKSKKLNRDMG